MRQMSPTACQWAGIPWYRIVPFLQHSPASGVITAEKTNWMWTLLYYISSYHSGGLKRALEPSWLIQCVNSPTAESQLPLAWDVASVQVCSSMAGPEHGKHLHLKMLREQQEGWMKMHSAQRRLAPPGDLWKKLPGVVSGQWLGWAGTWAWLRRQRCCSLALPGTAAWQSSTVSRKGKETRICRQHC